jgi:hypothetical protein
MWIRNVRTPRPKGNVALHQIHLSAVDENFNEVPQHILYNHHSLILVGRDIYTAFGAEGAHSPVIYPTGYAALLGADQILNVTTMYLPLMGFAAMTPTRVFVNFTLVYTPLDDEEGVLIEEELNKWKYVDMDLTGIILKNGVVDFDIPGGGEMGSSYCVSNQRAWRGKNTTLVYMMGHLHIGGINLTLFDSSNNDAMIGSVAPFYDSNGFVSHMGNLYVNYPLINGNSYTTIACYQNDRPYKDVMGLIQLIYEYPIEDNNNSGHKTKRFVKF